MKCEEVRRLLPGMGELPVSPARVVQRHLEGCPDCSAELARYMMVSRELAGLRDIVLEPSEGLLPRLLAELSEADRRGVVRRVATDERFQHAAFSLGGAVVGAGAVGLLWWRAARRALTAASSR